MLRGYTHMHKVFGHLTGDSGQFRITCVRNMPDASTGSGELADVYRRLEEEASSKTPSNKDKKKPLEVESTQRSPLDNINKSKTSSHEQKSASLRVD